MIRKHSFSWKLRLNEKETCETVGQNNVLGEVRSLTVCCSKHKIEPLEKNDRLDSFQNRKVIRTQTL